jgi:hypothetical protein
LLDHLSVALAELQELEIAIEVIPAERVIDVKELEPME